MTISKLRAAVLIAAQGGLTHNVYVDHTRVASYLKHGDGVTSMVSHCQARRVKRDGLASEIEILVDVANHVGQLERVAEVASVPVNPNKLRMLIRRISD